jgi:hypothetical protein
MRLFFLCTALPAGRSDSEQRNRNDAIRLSEQQNQNNDDEQCSDTDIHGVSYLEKSVGIRTCCARANLYARPHWQAVNGAMISAHCVKRRRTRQPGRSATAMQADRHGKSFGLLLDTAALVSFFLPACRGGSEGAGSNVVNPGLASFGHA